MDNKIEFEQWTSTVLERAPALAGFPGRGEVIKALARRSKKLVVTRNGALKNSQGALRFILSGAVEVEHRLPGCDAQLLRDGSVTGWEGLASAYDWSSSHRLPRERLALAHGPLVAAEIHRDDIPKDLLAWLKQVYVAQSQTSCIVDALLREPRLALLRDEDAFRIVEAAYSVSKYAKLPLQEGEVPSDFYVLLSGDAEIRRRSQRVIKLKGPTCIAHKQFLLRREMPGEVIVNEDLICIDGRHLNALRQERNELDRALARGNPRPPPEPGPHGKATQPHLILVAGDEKLPLGQMIWLLAERMAVHLQEHVLVVRLATDGKPPPKPAKPLLDQRGWAREEYLAWRADKDWWTNELALLVARASWRQGSRNEVTPGKVDVVLVDLRSLPPQERTTAVNRAAEAFREQGQTSASGHARSSEEVKLVWVTADAKDLTPVKKLAENVKLVPTRILLTSKVPQGPNKPRRQRIIAAARAFAEHHRAGGETSKAAAVWPMGTVRLPIPQAWTKEKPLLPETLSVCETETTKNPERVVLRDGFERWARAITGRRVGLALGGGGSFGGVHLAVIEKLLARNDSKPGSKQAGPALDPVPIDLVSGSSAGTTMGTYLCVLGLEQPTQVRKRLIDDFPGFYAALLLGSLSSATFQLYLDYVLGAASLDDLPVPMFPVATDADRGVEWDVLHGSVGLGIRASGSLPLLTGPTFIRNRRLLDGGVAANVPVNILRAEGADLILASNPIPRLSPRARKSAKTPLDFILRSLDPMRRVGDVWRMLKQLGRNAGESQLRGADLVVYAPKYSEASLFSPQIEKIACDALESAELNEFVLNARLRWRTLLNNPPSLLQWNSDATEAKVHVPALSAAGSTRNSELLAHQDEVVLDQLLEELLEPSLLKQHKDRYIGSFKLVLLSVGAGTADRKRADLVADYLVPYLPAEVTVESRRAAAGESAGLKLSDVKTVEATRALLTRIADLRSLDAQRKKARQRAETTARTHGLLQRAEYECKYGDVGLAGRLAIQTSRLDSGSPEVDRMFRMILSHRGQEQTRYKNEYSATCFDLSPCEQFLAVGGKDNKVRVWKDQGTEPWRKYDLNTAHDPKVNAVAWSPAGNPAAGVPHVLAACGTSGILGVWELSQPANEDSPPERTVRREWDVKTWSHWGLAFSPDGELLLGPWSEGAWGDQHAALFSLTENEPLPLREPEHPAEQVDAAAWEPRPGSRTFATLDKRGGKVTLWSFRDGTLRKLRVITRIRNPCGLAWKPGANVIAVCGSSTVGVYELANASADEPIELQAPGVHQVAWAHDGSKLLAATHLGIVYAWDWPSLTRTTLRAEKKTTQVNLHGHPKRAEIILVTSGPTASVWDLRDSRRLARLNGHRGDIKGACWSRDGERLMTSSIDETVRVWDPELEGPRDDAGTAELDRREWITGAQAVALDRLPTEAEARELDGLLDREGKGSPWVSLSPDRKRGLIAVQSGDELDVLLGSGVSNALSWHPPAGRSGAFTVADQTRVQWAPSGEHAAIWNLQQLSIWSSRNATLWRVSSPEIKQIRSVCWDPRSRFLAVGAEYNLILVDPVARTERSTALHTESWSLAWDSTGNHVAAGGNDSKAHILKLRDARTLECVMEIPHPVPVECVAWSPSGLLLATGDQTGIVRVWTSDEQDLAYGAQIRRRGIRHLVWNRDGSRLLSINEGGHTSIWALVQGRWSIIAEPPHDAFNARWAGFSGEGDWAAIMTNKGKLLLDAVHFERLLEQLKRRIDGAPRGEARPLAHLR